MWLSVKLVGHQSHPFEAHRTCHFVANQLGRLHLPDAAEEAPQLVLRHALRQVVNYQVGLGVFPLVPSQVVFVTVRHFIHVLQVSQVGR